VDVLISYGFFLFGVAYLACCDFSVDLTKKLHQILCKSRPKKARQVKSKVRSIVHQFIWQAKQSIPHTAVMYYSDCMKLCEDLTPKFGDK
jgi:hypothetical protein